MLTTLDDLAKAIDPALLFADLVGPADPWQASVLRSTAPRLLLLTTRQAGKSTTTAVMALHEALFHPGSLVLLVSPSLRQSSELYRKIAGFWHALGRPIPAEQESATSLALANGSRLISLPGSPATVRGFSSPRLVVVDEAAQVEESLFGAMAPMLAASPGGRLVCLSTPLGARGTFYEWWHDKAGPWERVRVTAEACPRIRPEFLAEMKMVLGERWYRQEFLCSFESTIDQVFSTESVLGAFTSGERPLFAGGT